MSTTEIVNRLSETVREYEDSRDGTFATDMVVDTAKYELYKAVELMVKAGVLPAEALEAV